MAATVEPAPASFTSTTTSRAPAWASPFAIAAPRPLPPPVTTATRPSRRKRLSTKPAGTSNAGSSRSSVEAIVRLGEPLRPGRGDDRVVLPAEPAEPLDVDSRLRHDHHSGLQLVVAPRHELRARLVVAEAGSV